MKSARGAAANALAEPTDAQAIAEAKREREDRMCARERAFALADTRGKVTFRVHCKKIMKELEGFSETARSIEFGWIIERMLAKARHPGPPGSGNTEKITIVQVVDYMHTEDKLSFWVESPLWEEAARFLESCFEIKYEPPTVRTLYYEHKDWVHQKMKPQDDDLGSS